MAHLNPPPEEKSGWVTICKEFYEFFDFFAFNWSIGKYRWKCFTSSPGEHVSSDGLVNNSLEME